LIEDKIITEKKKISITAKLVTTLVMLLLVIAGIFVVLRTVGKNNLYELSSGLDGIVSDLGDTALTDEPVELSEGHILYDGKEYAPNPDLVCILVMGIDTETVTEIGGQSWDVDETSANNGGQADALFLLLLNPHDEKISVVSINRNSMADVDVWDSTGAYRGVFTQQIALQHGYGTDQIACAEHQVKAVSRLMHNIPIHAYAAISMDAIPELNDSVGGVTVEVLETIVYPEYDMDLHQGETVTLMGDKAYWYVRLRDENLFDSNSMRLERQKQYLTSFAAKAKETAGGDISVAIDLFNIMQKYMVTDLNVSSFTYLASETMDYEFDVKNMYSIEGETVQGNEFEEYYINDEALQALIVKLFYEPVK